MEEETLWQDLARYADDEDTALPDLPNEAEWQAPVPVGDRLAELYLRGTLPVLFLTLTAAALIGAGTDGSNMSLGLVMAPILVWVLTPYVRGQNGLSPGRFIAMSLLILVLNILLGLGSATLFLYWNNNPIHLEVVAWAIQGILETVLTRSILVYPLVGLALPILARKVVTRYPWIDDSPWSRGHRLAGWLGLVLMLLVVMSPLTGLLSSPREVQWKAEVRRSISTRPFADLPGDGPERLWQKRLDDADGRIAKESGGDGFSSRAHREKALAGLPLFLDLSVDRPTSRRELRAAVNYLAAVKDGDLPAEDVQVRHIEAQLKAFPFNRSIGVAGLVEHFVLPAIAESQKGAGDLESLAREIQGARAEIQSPLENLDQMAYWLLWEEPQTMFDRGSEPGWKTGDSQISPSTFHRSLVYRGSPQPRPLKAFGYELEWSPTRLVSLWQRRRLTADWLSLRERIEAMAAKERTETLKARSQEEEVGLGKRFWEEISYSTSPDRSSQLLETAELMTRILQDRQRTGHWPLSLESLLNKVQFSNSPEGRYRWDADTQSLYDTVLGEFPLRLVGPKASPE